MLWPQSALAIDEKEKTLVLKQVEVVGTKDDIKDIAASAHLIETQDILKHSYDNIDRLLRKIPGVYTREEDGQGLFPNISIRGVDPGRSAKVTIMEDGVLMAPAPYSAPSAYYSPTAGRMSAIEILKGSSQVRYGPHTTGGVINYRATEIPQMQSMFSRTLMGSYGEIRNHTYFGDTLSTGSGRFGYVIENYYRENNGFREIQPTGDFRNGDNTGLQNLEPMIKLMFEPGSSTYQRFEFKFGYTNREANESYLGQPEADFRNNPFRRLAASRFDLYDTEQYRTHIRHFIELTPKTNLVTTAYGSTFWRNWAKLGRCTDTDGTGTTALGLSQCMKDPDGNALLQGQGPGEWRLTNNNRNYYMYGVESQLTHMKDLGATQHTFHAGVRYHYDQIRRFQWHEFYNQDANGFINSQAVGPKGGAGNRRQKTTALAFNVDDQIRWGSWTFKPGARYEQLWQKFENFDSGDSRDRTYGVWAAGGSLDYRFNESTNVFAGIHRGFSVPGPSGATKVGSEQIEEETSIGYELGTRYNRPDLGFRTEVIGFWTDFDNLIGISNLGAGGGGGTEVEDVGEVRTRGIEFMVEYDPSVVGQWSVRNPWYFTATYTDAEFRHATGPNSSAVFKNAAKGNELPYIPEIQFAVGSALIWQDWTLSVDGQYIDSTFGTGDNSTNELDGATGDVRFGKTDSVFLLDLSLAHQLNEHVNLFTNFRNVTDATYLAGRLPEGPRAGAPFQMFGGIEITY
ncbi:TonB-dependent receptor family protein [Nitrospina watsonii]|nr:TonB-dependent receptor [Nitrospina watsonii]